jgi:hypothetical protein
MTKQTIILFTKALVIGILLNMGLYYVSESPQSQQAGVISQEAEIVIGQASTSVELPFLDPVNR